MDLKSKVQKRRNRTKGLVFAAMVSALGVLFLFLGNLTGVADLSFAGIASLLLWILLLEYGSGYALGAYLAISILSLLLLPDKAAALLFAGLTGWYPLLKRPFERLPLVLAYLCKFLSANAVCFLLFWLFRAILGLQGYTIPLLLLLLLLYNAAFFLFDIALTRLIWLYIGKFRKYLRKSGLCKE